MAVLSNHRLGQPGVELTGLHDDVYTVKQILPFASEVYIHSQYTVTATLYIVHVCVMVLLFSPALTDNSVL